jgi:hypothetical protein
LFIEESDSRQGRLPLETAKLSEGFFDQLKNIQFRSRKPPSKLSRTMLLRLIVTSGLLIASMPCGQTSCSTWTVTGGFCRLTAYRPLILFGQQ